MLAHTIGGFGNTLRMRTSTRRATRPARAMSINGQRETSLAKRGLSRVSKMHKHGSNQVRINHVCVTWLTDTDNDRGDEKELVGDNNSLRNYNPQENNWFAVSNKQVPRCLTLPLVLTLGHTGRIRSVQFSPDGQYLAMFIYGSAKIFEVRTGDKLPLSYQYKTKIATLAVSSVFFSPYGRYLVGDSLVDRAVIVWDIKTGENHRLQLAQDEYYSFAIFSSDGKLIAPRSDEGTIKLWELDIGGTIRPLATKFQNSPTAENQPEFIGDFPR
jgi:WD40 repeat protein